MHHYVIIFPGPRGTTTQFLRTLLPTRCPAVQEGSRAKGIKYKPQSTEWMSYSKLWVMFIFTTEILFKMHEGCLQVNYDWKMNGGASQLTLCVQHVSICLFILTVSFQNEGEEAIPYILKNMGESLPVSANKDRNKPNKFITLKRNQRAALIP